MSWATSSLVSRLRDTTRRPGAIPAQLTRMRSMPLAARALSSAASTDDSDETSQVQYTAPISAATASPRAAFMSKIATLAPAARNMRAVASPRPEAPPVTMAAVSGPILMARSSSGGHSCWCCLPAEFHARQWASSPCAACIEGPFHRPCAVADLAPVPRRRHHDHGAQIDPFLCRRERDGAGSPVDHR